MEQIKIYVKNQEIAALERKFGIFFEDINHGADGGLYGELVQNRSFEFDAEENPEYHAMTAWETAERGDSMVIVHTESAYPMHLANPHYLVLEGTRIDRPSGIRNIGYNAGIPVETGKSYRFSCFARTRSRERHKLAIRLEDAAGEAVYGEGEIGELTDRWERYACMIKASDTDYRGRLAVLLRHPECVELDMVSLFPEDTFLGRENGLRKDLAQMLADLKPGFLRFPGGCLVQAGSLDAGDKSSIYRWKNTVLPVEERPSRRNNMWHYDQTLGLGFYELFLLCEDLGAEPMPVVSAGYDSGFRRKASGDGMQEWIDEAVDLIEFANGGTDTKWGAVRARMGHPESFHLRYLTIGNEEVGEGYFENYEIISRAVGEKHPEITLINSAIIGSYKGKAEDGMDQALRMGTKITDIHNYSQPEWFLTNYDVYTRCPDGVRVYLGEYSTCDDAWRNALMEAAFLTELEKSEKVAFACYAPLFNNVDYQNWHPNLIHFDGYRAYGTPSYHVQKLFMNHQGKCLLEACDNLPGANGKMQSLSGEIFFKAGEADIEICGFRLTNTKTGEVRTVPDFRLDGECGELSCGESGTDHYVMEFSFRKESGGGHLASQGRCALTVTFARTDEKNMLTWSVDGWERTTVLTGRLGCGRTHAPFSVQIGKAHRARIEVEGGRARTYIDGVPCNDVVCRELERKELYYSVVRMEDGSLVIKMVNLLPKETEVCMQIPMEGRYQVQIACMAGYGPKERNSLKEPERVSPVTDMASGEGGSFRYRMPGEGVAVLRFQPWGDL